MGQRCVTGKRKLWKQTGEGQKLISSPRLKAHLSRHHSFMEADSTPPLDPHANGGAGGVGSAWMLKTMKKTVYPTVQLPLGSTGTDVLFLG